MTPSQDARKMFDQVRHFWHYAPRGTPDGTAFEKSERGQMLMRSLEHLAHLRTPAGEVGELVKELRFLADSRQQMGFDRAGAAMDNAATMLERLAASDTEAMLAAAYEAGATDTHNWWAAGNVEREPDFTEAALDYARDALAKGGAA